MIDMKGLAKKGREKRVIERLKGLTKKGRKRRVIERVS